MNRLFTARRLEQYDPRHDWRSVSLPYWSEDGSKQVQIDSCFRMFRFWLNGRWIERQIGQFGQFEFGEFRYIVLGYGITDELAIWRD